jgi:cell division protein YceG involved in septum cleavage
MRSLFLIFIHATGYAKLIGKIVLVSFVVFLLLIVGMAYCGWQATSLKSQIVAQQETVEITKDLVVNAPGFDTHKALWGEKQKLIELRCRYDTLRNWWVTGWFVD